jgi:YD repeat-containing protein
MVCARCRTVFTEWQKACPACGSPVAGSGAGRALAVVRRGLLACLLVILALALIVTIPLFVSGRLPLSLWTIPLVREILDRANDHPEVVSLIGEPVRLRWLVTGQVRADETGWREFLLQVPVSGPRSLAAMHVRAGRAGRGPWTYTTLELESEAGRRVNVLEPPRAAVPKPPARRVYLVPLGSLTHVSLEELARYYRARLGLEIGALPAVNPAATLFDYARQQLVAEVAVEWLRWHLRSLLDDPSAVVIAITGHDMYIRGRSWRFAFSYRGDDRFAMVSTAHMLPFAYRHLGKEYLVHTRVRKMVGKNIGLLAYRFPTSTDRTSPMYGNILSVADLDAMRDNFDAPPTQAGAADVPVSHRLPPVEPELIPRAVPVNADGNYPCFVVQPGVALPGDGQIISTRIGACLPGMRTEREYDEFEVDLRSGLFVARKTDLLVPDAPPLTLTRCYRLWDEGRRAFGIGTNHPYDVFPIGSRQPYTYVDVIMADGSRIHYDRISKGTSYADAVYEHVATATPFLRSRFRWNGNGWDLQFEDESVFVFPESYAATRSAEGALIEIRGRARQAVKFHRDRRRNLLELTAPGGGFIKFEYDSEDRITVATDHRGRRVRYEYDPAGRLAVVTDGTDRPVRYSYDGAKLVAVNAGDGAPRVGVRYFNDRVSELRLADGRVYRFRFTFDQSGRVSQALVTDPDGTSTEIDVQTGTRRGVIAGR